MFDAHDGDLDSDFDIKLVALADKSTKILHGHENSVRSIVFDPANEYLVDPPSSLMASSSFLSSAFPMLAPFLRLYRMRK